MSTLAKILLAILLGVLATGLLDFFGVLNHGLNAVIGVVVALVFYFGYNGDRVV